MARIRPGMKTAAQLATDPALGAALVRLRPTVWATATGRPNGAAVTADSGQALTLFGNAPLAASGELFVHTPAQQANSAGYMQADAGSSVVATFAEIVYPAGSTGAVALVLPKTSWYVGGALNLSSQAGVHFVIYGDGSWHVSNWNGSAEDTFYASGKCAVMQDGQARRVELHIDRATSTLLVYLPDGTTVAVTDSRIAANTGTLAIAELYESNGVGAVPAQIKSWGVQGSADVAFPRNPASATKGDIARAVQQYRPSLVAMKQYTPGTDPAIAVPTSSAEVSAGNTEVTFTAPPSGKVRLTATGYLTMTAAAKVIWSFLDQNGVTRAGVQVAIDGQQNGPRTVQWLITGLTGGASYTLRWFHFATVASAAVFHAHGGSGYFADMSVDPVT